jgi:hypothetical protein
MLSVVQKSDCSDAAFIQRHYVFGKRRLFGRLLQHL